MKRGPGYDQLIGHVVYEYVPPGVVADKANRPVDKLIAGGGNLAGLPLDNARRADQDLLAGHFLFFYYKPFQQHHRLCARFFQGQRHA